MTLSNFRGKTVKRIVRMKRDLDYNAFRIYYEVFFTDGTKISFVANGDDVQAEGDSTELEEKDTR